MRKAPGKDDENGLSELIRDDQARYDVMSIVNRTGHSASDISEWMKKVEEAKPSINIATLVGHGTMRDKSGIKIDPNPTNKDLKKMAMLIDEGIEAGAFGLSTGL